MANKKISDFASGGAPASSDIIPAVRAGANISVTGIEDMATQTSSAVNITGGTISGIDDIGVADGGTGASTASAARTNLGLVIGTDVQEYNDKLTSVTNLGTSGLVSYDSVLSGVSPTVLTGTSNQITVLNGDGVAGNPTLSLPYNLELGASSVAGSSIKFFEDTDNGSNFITLKSPDSLSANTTYTLPTADGSSSQVLSTNGSGSLSWATASSGSLVFISSQTASSSATLDFTTGIDSTYSSYLIIGTNMVCATDAVSLYLRTSANAGSSWDSGASDYAYNAMHTFATSNVNVTAASQINMTLGTSIGNAAGENFGFTVQLFRPPGTNYPKIIYNSYYDGYLGTTGSAPFNELGVGNRRSTAAYNGIRLFMSSGNITSGTVRLYGIKNS